MTRRPPRRLLVAGLGAIVMLSSCSTFSDNDAYARVGDVELNADEFDARARSLGIDTTDAVIAGDAARAVASTWIATQLADQVGLVDEYEAGPEASGLVCVSLLQIADAADADAYLDRLRGGEDWYSLYAEVTPDDPVFGRVNCIPTEGLGELGPQVAGMSLDDPYRELLFPNGAGVAIVRMQPSSELNAIELLSILQATQPDRVLAVLDAAADADLYVSPKLGRYDTARLEIVPLGDPTAAPVDTVDPAVAGT